MNSLYVLANVTKFFRKLFSNSDRCQPFFHPDQAQPPVKFKAAVGKMDALGIAQPFMEADGGDIFIGDQGVKDLVALGLKARLQGGVEPFSDAPALGLRL